MTLYQPAGPRRPAAQLGVSDEAFLKRLSKTWAGLPKDMSGSSYYAGDKIGNKAGIDYSTAMASLQTIRSDLGST